MPPIKKHFQIPITHLPPILKKFPQLNKNAPNFFNYHLKNNWPQLKICPYFFQICQSQMRLKKELYGPLLDMFFMKMLHPSYTYLETDINRDPGGGGKQIQWYRIQKCRIQACSDTWFWIPGKQIQDTVTERQIHGFTTDLYTLGRKIQI